QLGQDQQAAERGAQLVRDVGHELGLGPRGDGQLPGVLVELEPGLLDLRELPGRGGGGPRDAGRSVDGRAFGAGRGRDRGGRGRSGRRGAGRCGAGGGGSCRGGGTGRGDRRGRGGGGRLGQPAQGRGAGEPGDLVGQRLIVLGQLVEQLAEFGQFVIAADRGARAQVTVPYRPHRGEEPRQPRVGHHCQGGPPGEPRHAGTAIPVF